MQTKLLALALAVMLTIGTGGVIAADSVTSDNAQLDDRTDDAPTQIDDKRSTESGDQNYDKKLTADEHVEFKPTMIALLGDGQFKISLQGPSQHDVAINSTGNGTMAFGNGNSSADQTANDADYDKKLTADEHVSLQPSVIKQRSNGLISVDLQEPTQQTVSVNSEIGGGTVTVET